MRAFMTRFWRDESGTTAIEYGLIVALLLVAILVTLTAFGAKASGMINDAMITLRDTMS